MNRRQLGLGIGAAGLGASAISTVSTPSFAAAPMGGAITDVAGLRVGHFTDSRRPTGCTVILAEEGAVAGVDVRGSAPGTRETDLLDPSNLVDRVFGVVLSGGSAFGLAAADGVMRFLDERGVGFPAGAVRVPIVTGAVLFDLPMGDPRVRPDAEAGYRACQAASDRAPEEGSVGAGAGATVGKLFGMPRAMKSGIGTASARIGRVTLGAIVAVNAVGDVVDPATGAVLAGARDAPEGRRRIGAADAVMRGDLPEGLRPGMATTIGAVATDARLTKAEARKLAQMAHDGLARTIDPIHTMWDGDTIFCLGTGRAGVTGNMMALGVMAARVMAAAVLRAVSAATAVSGPGVPTLPAMRDLG